MPEHLFKEWMIYFNLEPFGSRHRDHLFANLTAVVANMFRSDDAEPFSPDDFIPKYGTQQQEHPATWQDDVAFIHAMVATGIVKEQ